jgi:hypothetical protein
VRQEVRRPAGPDDAGSDDRDPLHGRFVHVDLRWAA